MHKKKLKKVGMIKKYNIHTLQTNPQYRKEELQNSNRHNTSGKQLKLSNQLLPPHQDCKTRKDTKGFISKRDTEPLL